MKFLLPPEPGVHPKHRPDRRPCRCAWRGHLQLRVLPVGCVGSRPPGRFLLPFCVSPPENLPPQMSRGDRGMSAGKRVSSPPRAERGQTLIAEQNRHARRPLSTPTSSPSYLSHFPFCGQGFYLISTLSSSVSFSVSLLTLATERENKQGVEKGHQTPPLFVPPGGFGAAEPDQGCVGWHGGCSRDSGGAGGAQRCSGGQEGMLEGSQGVLEVSRGVLVVLG